MLNTGQEELTEANNPSPMVKIHENNRHMDVSYTKSAARLSTLMLYPTSKYEVDSPNQVTTSI